MTQSAEPFDTALPSFTPRPWVTVDCEIDLPPGGVFSTAMRSLEGETIRTDPGRYLEVVENHRHTFTDELCPGCRLEGQSFLTVTFLLEPEGKGTRYTATAMHANP